MALGESAAVGYVVEASGFADGFVCFVGATYGECLRTKEQTEASAKGFARQLMAEKSNTGRVVVRLGDVVVKDLSLRNGKWAPTAQVSR